MRELQNQFNHPQKITAQRFNNVEIVMQQLIQSTQIDFNKMELKNQVRSEACMLGIQEMASRMNVTILSLSELMESAHCQCTNQIWKSQQLQ